MKYLILLFVAGWLAACTGTNKHETGPEAARDSINRLAMRDTASYTTIQWIDSTFNNVGKISEGQVVEVSWRFRNTGSRPLIIENVTAGCGCTVAERPEEPVAPGKEGVIKAKFNSQGQHLGENQKNVTVKANTKGETVHYLTFRVDITK